MDLPDLALERIAAHLPLSDLASCMMCCATLHKLLRPQQTAMVRACRLGKKWVLRACGRSLITNVASRHKAGIAGFKYPGRAQNWDACCACVIHLAGNFQRHFLVAEHSKVLAVRDTSGTSLSLEGFFYLCALAESCGFRIIVRNLQEVWHRVVCGLFTEEEIKQGLEWPFHKFRNIATRSDLAFQPASPFSISQFLPKCL